MKHLPSNVRGVRDDARGYGYLVTLPNGREEWYRLAWQAMARSRGWTPPPIAEEAPRIVVPFDYAQHVRDAVTQRAGRHLHGNIYCYDGDECVICRDATKAIKSGADHAD